MSIRIEIGDKWVITSDQYQFILNEKKVVKSGKKAGEEWLDTIGYYPKINQLISGLLHHHIQNSTITLIQVIAAEIEKVGALCADTIEKSFYQYTPGSKIPSRNLSDPFRNPMHLLDQESGEIHTLRRTPPTHHT